MSKSLKDFEALHSPMFRSDRPVTKFGEERKFKKGCKRFIITTAQNGTPVNDTWWATLLNMSKVLKAELLVIPIRYKNPTSSWSASQSNEEYWVSEVAPYLWNMRVDLNQNLTVLGDIKTQPTAVSPLTGFEAFATSSSGIIGHTKVQMKAVPSPSNKMAKVMVTTGACTVPNYTDSRAGAVGEFHHSLSAILVEIDSPSRFFMRHLHFDEKSGSCIDLDKRYYPNKVTKAPRALALVMGDTHVDCADPDVINATFGPGGIVPILKPKHLVWHDLLDGYSMNPHHVGKPLNKVGKMLGNAGNVRAEVQRAIKFIEDHTPEGTQSVIVASNHNDFLGRWIDSHDWRGDPVNAEFYLETALAMVRGTRFTPRGTEYPEAFAYWMRQAKLPNCRILDMDESFVLEDVELGMHGNLGPNGVRGSINNLRRISNKSIIGHSHTPGIEEGCYQVGTNTYLRLEYNKGASSWLNADCVLNADGKRQLLIIVDGRWRLAD
jgi:hypothetical protein